jgi:hypothetical protein
VDDDFLATIEGWCTELARNLALRNPRLTQRELNFAVQRIIGRIIFLRICEDRGIEDYGRLRALTNGERIYPRLCQLFEAADDRYNSGLFHERALPDLGHNIKCGNSLIGPDFYEQQQMALLDDEERYRINVFDWRGKDGFPGVMKAGGFDGVIGNPPYFKVSGRDDPLLFEHLRRCYENASFKIEYYVLFAERAISLVREGGLQSFVVPNSFLAGVYLKPLRELMAARNALLEAVLLKDVLVFKDARLDSVVYVVRKGCPEDSHRIVLRLADASMQSSPAQTLVVTKREWESSPGREFRITAGALPPAIEQCTRAASATLGQIATVHLGLVLESNDLLQTSRSRSAPNPVLHGRDIGRYGAIHPQHWFNFKTDPMIGGTKNPSVYQTGPRIILQAIRNLKLERRIVATMVQAGTFTDGTLHNIIVRSPGYSPLYILGVLNSNLLNAFYAASFPEHRIKGRYLESLPIPKIDFADRSEKLRHDRLVALVDQMLASHRQRAEVRTPAEQTALDRQIAATDAQIDRLVYALYGLTEDEIRIVEGTAR